MSSQVNAAILSPDEQVNPDSLLGSLRAMPKTMQRLLSMFLVPAGLLAFIAAGTMSGVMGAALHHNAEESVRRTAAALGPAITVGAYNLDTEYLESMADSIIKTPNITSVVIEVPGMPTLKRSREAVNGTPLTRSYHLTEDIKPPKDAESDARLGILTIATNYQEADALIGWNSAIGMLFITLVSLALISLSLLALKALAFTPVAAFAVFVAKSGRPSITTFPGETEIDSFLRFAREQVITLTASEERSRLLIESSGVGVFDTDHTARETLWNDRLREILGIDPAFKPAFGIEPDVYLAKPERLKWTTALELARMSASRLGGVVRSGHYSVELEFLRPDGRVIVGLVNGVIIMSMTNELVRSIGSITDLTERREWERQLLEERRRLELVVHALDSAQDNILIENQNGKIVHLNRPLAIMSGVADPSQAIGMAIEHVSPRFAEIRRNAVERLLTQRAVLDWRGDLEVPHETKPVTLVWDTRVSALSDGGFITAVTDITERVERIKQEKSLSDKLAEAQKMESLARLAGGIAHDFNNIVGAQRMFASLIADATKPESDLHKYAGRIIASCDRAADLVRQIMMIYRAHQVKFRPTSLQAVLGEIQSLLPSSRFENAKLLVEAPAPDIIIPANDGQLIQVLLNLGVNAIDALENSDGYVQIYSFRTSMTVAECEFLGTGVSSILLPNPRGSEVHRYFTGALRPGASYACVVVRDNGSGISRDVLERIFEPFYTTKSRGKGNGLGLAVVSSVIAVHSGAIFVTTGIGLGTRIAIYLPCDEVHVEVDTSQYRG